MLDSAVRVNITGIYTKHATRVYATVIYMVSCMVKYLEWKQNGW